MITPRRGARAPWQLILALLVAACGGPGEKVRTCSTDAECGPGALCIQAACATNRPPEVTLQLPPSPTTNRVLFLDATATDPDAGDSITRVSWTVTPVSAACEAEPEPSTGPRLELVFWCAGAYEVAVVAEDGRGGTSAPAKQTVEVAQATGAPVVTPGGESSLDHACGGTPFACRPASSGLPVSLPLSAVVGDPAGGALTYRWRMIPAPGADPEAVVTYGQGDTSLSTEAWVETPGGAIAGTWRFRLRVTTAAGLVGRADQVVLIGNRPPVLAGQPFQLDHRYEGGAYLASGSLPVVPTDPDGDPVSLIASLDEVGTTGCTSSLGPVTAGALPFETRCTEAAPMTGLASRTIRVTASDGNGGTTEAAFPVEIGNRPPALRLASNPAANQLTLDHTVGACPGATGSCYLVAGTAAFDVVDPDGDPVSSVAVAAAVQAGLGSSTGEATTAGGVTTFRFATAVALPGQFRLRDGTTGFSLVATAADPFGAAGRVEVPVLALNRPPVVKLPRLTVVVPHRYDTILKAYLATAPLATFEDPDGDPLRTSGSAGDAACATFTLSGGAASVACQSPYAVAPGLPPLASFLGDHRVVASANDGWEQVTSPTTVNLQDGAPSATPFEGVVDSCFCACSKWSADGSTCVGTGSWVVDTTSVPLPVLGNDADGDPVQVTFSPAVAGGAQKTVLPTSCSATLVNPTLPITVQVTIDDGLAQAKTTSRVTGVRCTTAGQACVP